MFTFKEETGIATANMFILICRKKKGPYTIDERKKYFTYDDTYDHTLYCGKLKLTNMDENGNIYDKIRIEDLDTKVVKWYDNYDELEVDVKVYGKTLKQYEDEGSFIYYPIINFYTYCHMAKNSQYFELEYTHNGIPYIIQAEDPTGIVADYYAVSEEDFERSAQYYDTVFEMFENYVFLDGVRLWDEKDKVVERAKEYFVYFT